MIRSHTGRSPEEMTLDRVTGGEFSDGDVRISAQTLERQAALAIANGNPQLGDNLMRAAEMTHLSDERVLAIYEALRPGRATATQLRELADELEQAGLPRCTALIREAMDVYLARGLLR